MYGFREGFGDTTTTTAAPAPTSSGFFDPQGVFMLPGEYIGLLTPAGSLFGGSQTAVALVSAAVWVGLFMLIKKVL